MAYAWLIDPKWVYILWYAYSCMREDQELACDALALVYIDLEEHPAYGRTIISLLEHYSGYYQVPSIADLSRNKRTLKRRILMIKRFQKKSYRWSTIGFITIATISVLTLLNAHTEETKQLTKESPATHKNNKYPTGAIIINYGIGEVSASNGQYQFEIKQKPSGKVNGNQNMVITRENQELAENSGLREGGIIAGGNTNQL